MENEIEIDNFKADVKTTGGSSLMIIIPSNIAKFSGIKEKDIVKIWIKKIEEQ
jgi:hypothetical protein